MDSFPKVFTASIETEHGKCIQHPWHLGTIEPIARECVEHIFKSRQLMGLSVLTVALKFDGHIIDVWDGKDWANAILEKIAAEAVGEWA